MHYTRERIKKATVVTVSFWLRSRINDVDGLSNLIIRRDFARLTCLFSVDKHGWCTAHSHILAFIEISLNFCFKFVGVETSIERVHIQPDAFRHSLQTAVA